MSRTHPRSPAGHSLGLHPRSAELAQRGSGPASALRNVWVPRRAEQAPPLPHLSGPFSPSPVRPLDGRVGLDPKGLGKHVCSSGLGRGRRAQEPGPSGKRERGGFPTRSPGGSHAGAQLEKGPGWKPGPLGFAATGAAGTAAAP